MQDPIVVETRLVPTAQATAAAIEPEPELATRQLTQAQLAWIRFRRHKPAMIGIAVILFMIAIAVFAPLITPESPYDMFSFDATNQSLSPRFTPGWWFMFGTDTYGHTIVSQIMWGARISLTVGFVSAFGTAIIGVLVGSVAGYFGGWIDTLMMRVTDVFLTLPFLPLLILAAAIWGQGHLWVIIGIFIVFTWPGTARLARASYLSLRSQEFTEAARAVGVGDGRIIFRHLLPSALRPLIVATTLNIAAFIVVEASIDYLGAGVVYPNASWGNILSEAQNYLITGNWWWATFPGVAIVLTVLAVNFVGDGLGDALDVRAKL